MKKWLFCFLLPVFLAAVPYSALRAPWLPFVSGDGFRAYCDYVFDEEDRSLDPRQIKPYGTIFVKGDFLNQFFETIHPLIPNKYILVTHNSDGSAPGAFASFLQDEKLVAWFGQNIDSNEYPKLHPIPIGIANRMWPHGNGDMIKRVQRANLPKTHFLYVNFSCSTFPQERYTAHFLLSRLPFCFVSHYQSFSTYLSETSSSQFVASPRGNGLDTHRLWEALYLESYPIVKSSTLDPLYEGLPVVVVSSWDEVTEPFLKKKKGEFQQKTFSKDKLSMQYWMNLIDSYKEKTK